MLVSEVIDRTYNEFLYPAGVNRPTFDVLAGALTASTSDLTITLEGRVDNIPRDSVIEIESELILNEETNGSVLTANQRGWLETEPAVHAIGTKVFVDPEYPRKVVFNSLNSVLGLLYPWGLYARATDTASTYTTGGVVSLPAGGKEVIAVLVRPTTASETYRRLRPGYDWTAYPEFDPVKYQLLRGGGEGNALRVIYAKDFGTVATEADNLDTNGVPTTLQPYLSMAIAGYLLQGKEIPRVQVEEIRRLLAAQGVQVGQALNIGQQLLRTFQQVYVAAERRRLTRLDPPTFEWAPGR